MMRPDHSILTQLIATGSSVLDLGCGDAAIHSHLAGCGCTYQGVEISDTCVQSCIHRGIPVIHGDIDQIVPFYADGAFDYVLLNRTLQATRHPLQVLRQSVRIGRQVIVSFPNFGYHEIRWQLFSRGVMPKSTDLPFEWYDTPNIHLVTIRDFERLCFVEKIHIKNRFFYTDSHKISSFLSNLLSPYAMYLLTRTS